jgi:hypothetical protein
MTARDRRLGLKRPPPYGTLQEQNRFYLELLKIQRDRLRKEWRKFDDLHDYAHLISIEGHAYDRNRS